MRERATLPISARLLILSTGAAAVYALGVRLADAPSWTMKDVRTFAVAAGVLVGQLARRWAPLKIAFNVSQFVVGITLAEIAFQALRPGTPLQPWTWAAVAIAMSAYFVVNATLVVLVVSLVERKRFLT